MALFLPTDTLVYLDVSNAPVQVLGTRLVDRGFWAWSVNYQPYDVVQYQTSLYIALAANLNQPPTSLRDNNWSALKGWATRAVNRIEFVNDIAVSGSILAWEAWNRLVSGELYQVTILAEAGTATANLALQIASEGTDLAQHALDVAEAGTATADEALVLAQLGTVVPLLSALPDVNIPAPAPSQVLGWDGAHWVAMDVSSTGTGGGGDPAAAAMAYHALVVAEAGTATADTALSVASNGTDLANAAQASADAGIALANQAFVLAEAGTASADAGIALANQAFVLAEAGTAATSVEAGTRSQEDQFLQNQISAFHPATSRALILCAAYTPVMAGPDAAEYPVPFASDGTTSTSWNLRRATLRVQTSGSAPALLLESSTGSAAFTATALGTLTMPSGGYEVSGTVFSVGTVNSGDKLRFNVGTLGSAQNWTCMIEISSQ